MDAERLARREKMMEKVRKLLAMARDGRGNENEEATAMRQANKIMAEFGISEAEFDLSAIDAGEMEFGESQCGRDGSAPEVGKVFRSAPTWVGVLGVGVARFTDTIVTRRTTSAGKIFVFQGELQDTIFARWLMAVLIDSIGKAYRASGWTHKGEISSFKKGAASTLQSRLKILAAERQAMYQAVASTSRALVVVDRKAVEVAKRFGQQKTSRSRGATIDGARQAGGEAGARINIPAGRPIGGGAARILLK